MNYTLQQGEGMNAIQLSTLYRAVTGEKGNLFSEMKLLGHTWGILPGSTVDLCIVPLWERPLLSTVIDNSIPL